MSSRFLLILLFASLAITTGYKSVRHIYDLLEKKLISEQICRASEARLQVGATREVIDVARSALNMAGYSTAEVGLKSLGVIFAESKLNNDKAFVFKCQPDGISGVELSMHFPKNQLFTDQPGVFVPLLKFINCIPYFVGSLVEKLQGQVVYIPKNYVGV